jgi:hypothetical protein
MKLMDFAEQFGTEQQCRMRFKKIREKEGINCKRYSGSEHYWLKGKQMCQCKQCGFRTSLRSGTIMESSKLPFQYWFIALHLMTGTKKDISAHQMKRELGHKRYEQIWAMMHKIRAAMGQRDATYGLKDMIEFDEAYFPKATPKGVILKRGKGSQRKMNVAVMAESTPLEDIETEKKSSHCRYFKMKVLKTHKSDSVDDCVQESLGEKSIVLSDKATNYVDISKYVEGHLTEISDKKTTNETLKWVHVAISNAKRTLLGIYHKIKGANLQNYLDEFC